MGWGDVALGLLTGNVGQAAEGAAGILGGGDQAGGGDDSGGGDPVALQNASFNFNVGGNQNVGQGPDVIDNLGTMPMPRPVMPLGTGFGAMQLDTQAIVDQASLATGRRLSKKAIVKFILKWGWQIAMCAFQLDQQSLLSVFVSEKAKPARRRGPHLYTVLKRIRQGERYVKMLARVASKAGVKRRGKSAGPARGRVITFPARRKAK